MLRTTGSGTEGFGTVTVSSPFLYVALTSASSISPLKRIRRSKPTHLLDWTASLASAFDSVSTRLAKSQMSGFGGMLAMEIKGDGADATAVVDRLRLFTIAPSLGGTESLVTQPVTTTHHGLEEDQLRRRGISDSMIRLSIGLESAEDLIRDLNGALDAVSQ